MLSRIAGFFARVAERWTPDPLVIAIFLTGVAFLTALLFTDFTTGQAVDAWGHSYWELLRFTAQMILIADSGLGELIVNGFVAVSNSATLPLWTFFSAAFLNLFIPSAGGQWAVQGPIVVEAASQLGADIPRVAMAVAVGEVWTNTIQPLFAVPVLAIAGLHLRHIMGYIVVSIITGTAIISTSRRGTLHDRPSSDPVCRACTTNRAFLFMSFRTELH